MKVVIGVDGHVVGISDDEMVWHLDEGMRIETVESVPLFEHAIEDYVYQDGEFVYVEPEPDALSAVEVLSALFAAEPANLDVLPDEALARMAPYMQVWKPDEIYTVGDKRQYNELPYRCLQTHRSQELWNPEDAPSLWTRILIPDPTVIPEWVQPGSTNPYMRGDKVRHNGKVWVSDVDNNVWEPGVYGWTEAA